MSGWVPRGTNVCAVPTVVFLFVRAHGGVCVGGGADGLVCDGSSTIRGLDGRRGGGDDDEEEDGTAAAAAAAVRNGVVSGQWVWQQYTTAALYVGAAVRTPVSGCRTAHVLRPGTHAMCVVGSNKRFCCA